MTLRIPVRKSLRLYAVVHVHFPSTGWLLEAANERRRARCVLRGGFWITWMGSCRPSEFYFAVLRRNTRITDSGLASSRVRYFRPDDGLVVAAAIVIPMHTATQLIMNQSVACILTVQVEKFLPVFRWLRSNIALVSHDRCKSGSFTERRFYLGNLCQNLDEPMCNVWQRYPFLVSSPTLWLIGGQYFMISWHLLRERYDSSLVCWVD